MTWEILIAFLTGIGSILGAGWTLRRARREEREHCDARIAEIDRAYHKGVDEGMELEKRRNV